MEKLIKETIDTKINDIRNLFTIEKEKKAIKDRILRDIRNAFRLEKENNTIKDKILWVISNYFENKEEENYYKPVRESKFWSNNYNEYKNNSDRNKIVSVEEYLNVIRPYLKDNINNLKISDTWKTQLTIENNFICSIDNVKECIVC